jgi:hypothetical protein
VFALFIFFPLLSLLNICIRAREWWVTWRCPEVPCAPVKDK